MASPDLPQTSPPSTIEVPDIVVSPVEEHHNESSDMSDEDSNGSDNGDGMSNIDRRNLILQEQFASGMQDFGQERSHRKAAVLLLQWEKDGEDYMDTRDEVGSISWDVASF